MSIKPILFNTEMVLAILDGRKTVTRRAVKLRYRQDEGGFRVNYLAAEPNRKYIETVDEDGCGFDTPRYVQPPYQPGDIMWVRKTWLKNKNLQSPQFGNYEYRADYEETACGDLITWRPSIHMPKEAARIFLRVTNLLVERLQDITVDDIAAEGIELCQSPLDGSLQYDPTLDFERLWDSTIKPKDRDVYSFDANPWVWVIQFERCEKPEGWCETCA